MIQRNILKGILVALFSLILTMIATRFLSTRYIKADISPPTSGFVETPTSVNFATPCPDSTTLEVLIKCITDQMPLKNTNGFVEPTQAIQADWRTVIDQMLDGQCKNVDLPSTLTDSLCSVPNTQPL